MRQHCCLQPQRQARGHGLGRQDGRLWDADNGKELLVLRGHQAEVRAAAFSPDGKWLVTTAGNSQARLWPLDPLAEAQRRRPRKLTAEERQQFEVGELEKE